MNRPATNETREWVRSGLFVGERTVPLLGVDVRAEVVGGHAQVLVRQRYRNDEARPIEAVYTFPLPTRAVLSGFAMATAGLRLEGEVHEREEAFRRYDEAVSAGHGSALLEQERPNVFTANVGNLLPGEETPIEIQYIEPIEADEGAIRWNLPTLVAPRYVPGEVHGDRTGQGVTEPTEQVPDADRISPPTGEVGYGLSLEILFDVGCAVDVESPSHAIRATSEGGRTRVRLAQGSVALDRDVVVTAFPRSPAFDPAPLATVVAHRPGSGSGTFAVSIVPDLVGGLATREARNDVVFVLDRSGSMDGASMEEAKTALRLCLRQLQREDRFAILAFGDHIEEFAPALVALTATTLQSADAWLDRLRAGGGTELLEPLLRATDVAVGGVIVLLTDGQVANEDAIARQVLAQCGSARIYAFGIGTNISDALLVTLADKTGGAVERIHPGERVDDKVVAQFARAIAPRVTDLRMAFRGIDVDAVAPGEPSALVDGEPFTVFGTYESPGRGALEIRGLYDGASFVLEVPVCLPEREERPALPKLWAQARIRDLEHAVLTGRRAGAMRERIVQLAKDHGVSSKFTSFVVVERRAGDRRAGAQPETRVVAVNAPADWAMLRPRPPGSAGPGTPGVGRGGPSTGIQYGAGRPGVPLPAPRAEAVPPMPRRVQYDPRGGDPAPGGATRGAPMRRMSPGPQARPGQPRVASQRSAAQPAGADATEAGERSFAPRNAELFLASMADDGSCTAVPPALKVILGRQGASGLWEEPGRDTLDVTVEALAALLHYNVRASHPVHGAQVKKAIVALLEAVAAADDDVAPVALALGLAWLLSTGRRTRRAIEDLAKRRPGLESLTTAFESERKARSHVDRAWAARRAVASSTVP